MRTNESGMTLVEILVAIAIFSVVSVGFYSVMLSGVRSSDTTESVVQISEEARLGLNRMVRDTREGDSLESAAPTSYNVRVDFDEDGFYDNPNTKGDFENLTFEFVAGSGGVPGRITLNGSTLIDGVRAIPGQDVFTYYSSNLVEDADNNGIAEWEELDASGSVGVGNGNGVLDSGELPFITNVRYAVRVEAEDRATEFYAEAQLRNLR
jgi:prepilin-type N-terminal cleavage/methylation domain-containing protein